MKRYLSFLGLIIFTLANHFSYGQYSISGELGPSNKNKRVFLSLLRYDEQSAISKDQILTFTTTDSTGAYSFTGKLLLDKHKLYRIHTNIESDSLGLEFFNTDEVKNFHNFIFSNSDTLVFEKSEGRWFSPLTNTNTVDKEWREMNDYKRNLRKEFSGMVNTEAKKQSSSQILSELKSYAKETKTHSLVNLILLSEIQANNLKKDFNADPDFYLALQKELQTYYSSKSYSLQLEDLLSDLSIAQTQQQLTFYKRLVYILIFAVLVLSACIFYLLKRGNKKKENPSNEPLNLTKQEEKIAELIIQEKTNKEIAAELFISLSTVKTHVRNLYAKLEVNNRQQFIDKVKKSS